MDRGGHEGARIRGGQERRRGICGTRSKGGGGEGDGERNQGHSDANAVRR